MIDKKTFKLSILIPCFNEKLTIISIIDKVRKSLKKNNTPKINKESLMLRRSIFTIKKIYILMAI